jgi:rRNA processing protein Gar1
MKHAIVDKDNKVINIVIWEGKEWLPPRGHKVIQSDSANIGDIYDPVKNVFFPDPSQLVKPDIKK